ncbi:MAG: hypothetical protein AAB946_00670 [Patescibacteria group bacterium]
MKDKIFNFPYGISPNSLTHLEVFLEIQGVQSRRGRCVGRCALSRLVSEELVLIANATRKDEIKELDELEHLVSK